MDTGALFTGGKGDDSFYAADIAGTTSWTTGDALNGGLGNDSFTVTRELLITKPTGATVTGIETVTLTSGADVNINTTGFTGLTQLNVESAAAGPETITAATTTGVTIDNSTAFGVTVVGGGLAGSVTTGAAAITIGDSTSPVSTDANAYTSVATEGGTTVAITDNSGTAGAVGSTLTTITLNGNTDNATLTGKGITSVSATDLVTAAKSVTVADLDTAHALSLTLNGVDSAADEAATGGQTITFVDAEATSVAVSATGAASYDVTLEAAKATGVTIAADEVIQFDALTAGIATTVGISGDSAVTITTHSLAAAAVITSTNTAGVTFAGTLATGVQLTGGDGNDSLSLVGASTTAITTGKGDDTVTVATALGAGGSIDAGDGTDTLSMTTTLAANDSLSANATFAGTISGFEKLSLTGGGSKTVNLANLDNINYVTTVATGGTLVLDNMASGGTVKLTADTNTVTVAVTNAGVGTADVLNIIATKTGAATFGTVTAVNVETLNVTATDSTTIPLGTVADTLTTTATSAETINVFGNAGLTLTATALTVTAFNASGMTGSSTAAGAAAKGVTWVSGDLAAASTVTGSSGKDSFDMGNISDATIAVSLDGGLGGTAGAAGDTLFGGAGNDTITFSGLGDASLEGGGGDDTITGSTGADSIIGEAGNDTIHAGNGKNTVDGGAGNDIITAGTGNDSIDGGAGNDTITAGDGTNTVNGGAGNDIITGGAGVDSITGGDGVDSMVGGGGDDLFFATSAYFMQTVDSVVITDTVTGGDGSDTLTFTDAVALTAAKVANVTGVEKIVFAAGASSIILADVNLAGLTASTITLDGAATTTGFTATASAVTAAYSVVFKAGTGADSLTGSLGNDTFLFKADALTNADTIKAGAGTDTVQLTFVGSAGVTDVFGLTTGVEGVTVAGFVNDNTASTLTIQTGAAYAQTTAMSVDASALVLANDGTLLNTDVLSFSGAAGTYTGAFSVTGGAGNDTIVGSANNDTIIGSGGDDAISGGAGVDNLSGGAGNDTFVVTTASDFTGLTAAETVSGGAGTDTLSFANGLAPVISAADLLGISSIEKITTLNTTTDFSVTLTDAVYTANGNTSLIIDATSMTSGNLTVVASGLSAANSFTVLRGDVNADTGDNIVLGAGNDTLKVDVQTLNNATTTLTGGTGTDTLTLSGTDVTSVTMTALTTGFETIKFGADRAYVIITNNGNVAAGATLTVDGATLSDGTTARTTALSFNGTAELDGYLVMTGGTGGDTLTGGSLGDTLTGGAGADSLSGGAGADSLVGEAGADSLVGGAGVDTLLGGADADRLTGGAAADVLTGGAGNDTFVYTSATVADSNSATYDGITDWTSAADKLEVTLDYSASVTSVDVNATILTAVAGVTAAQDALSGARGQAVYDTTASALYINVNNDNLLTTSDFKIGLNAAATPANTVVDGDINFVVTGSSVADIIVTGGGADTISGGAGNDVIRSGYGADSVSGDAGDDLFVVVGSIDSTQAAAYLAAGSTIVPAAIGGVLTYSELTSVRTTSEALTGGSINGGADSDTLHVYGTASFTGITLSNIEATVVHSSATFTAAQVDAFTTITFEGNTPHTLTITNNDGTAMSAAEQSTALDAAGSIVFTDTGAATNLVLGSTTLVTAGTLQTVSGINTTADDIAVGAADNTAATGTTLTSDATENYLYGGMASGTGGVTGGGSTAAGDDTYIGGGQADYLRGREGGMVTESTGYSVDADLMFGGASSALNGTTGVYAESVDSITADSTINADFGTVYAPWSGHYGPSFLDANIFEGRGGNDILVASEAKDVFVYKTAQNSVLSDNSISAALYLGTDTIHNFEVGMDVIAAVLGTGASGTDSDYAFVKDAAAVTYYDTTHAYAAETALIAGSNGWTLSMNVSAATATLSFDSSAMTTGQSASTANTEGDFTINFVGLIGLTSNTTMNDFFIPAGA